MSARDAILARVRSALADVGTPARPRRSPTQAPGDDLVGLFVERASDYRAVVERCSSSTLGATVAAALPAGARVVVPAGLELAVAGASVDGGLSALELDGFDAVVTRARVAIAETGTIVLDHGAGQGRRALTLVPDRHVCIVEESQIVADVGQAVALLDPARPLTWVSGPSATSDIELDRVEGVHGPRQLHVLVVS